MIRIGSMMFQRSPNTPLESIFSPFENKSIKGSWVGVVSCGPFSVFYRRSKPRPAEKASESNKEIQRLRAARVRSMAAHARSHSISQDDSSGTDSESGYDCPSADESWGDDHSGGDECSSDEILSEAPGEESEEDISLESYPLSSCPFDLESPASFNSNSDGSDLESIKSDASIDTSLRSSESDTEYRKLYVTKLFA
ncbi:hypothetical protein BDV06DRAFT_111919 [Aspergillus oleicola]